MLLLTSIVALLLTSYTFGVVLNPGSDQVQTLALWAVEELKSLSDSGIYATLKLEKVIEAEEEEGIFHNNTILYLSLSSPHFKSQKPEEDFAVIVMKHHQESYATIAIDEFPEMDEVAIEKFYEQKVEIKRSRREQSFAQMEQEILLRSAKEGFQE